MGMGRMGMGRMGSRKMPLAVLLLGLALLVSGCFPFLDASLRLQEHRQNQRIRDCKALEGGVGYRLAEPLWEGPLVVKFRTCGPFGQDDQRLYGSDAASFEDLGRALGHYWGRDRSAVFIDGSALFATEEGRYYGRSVLEIDTASFGLPEPILLADGSPSDFVIAGEILMSDEGAERYGLIEKRHPFGYLEGADLETFTVLGRRYGRDANRVWYLDTPLEDVDAASFEALGERFARDRHAVYLTYMEIPGADPDSFELLSEYRATDAHRSYRAQLKDGGWILLCDEVVCLEAPKKLTLKGQGS